jgi:tetratricopeptide (TPR) repeat protein
LAGIGAIAISLFASFMAYMYREQVRANEQAARDRQRTIEAQIQLGGVLHRLGDSELERNNQEDALGQYLAALAIYQHLAVEDFNNLDHQERIADSLMRLGDIERRRGDMPRATEYYRRFRDLSGELVASYPQRREFQERAAKARQRWESLTTSQPATQPKVETAPAATQ